MSFFFPEANTDFIGAVKGETKPDDMHFVCYRGLVLQQFDEDGRWRPLTKEECDGLGEYQAHYMGQVEQRGCVAVEVADPGDLEFANLRMYLQNIDRKVFNIAGRALQICDWYRTHQYCGKCGTKTVEHANDRAAVCEQCNLHMYPRLSPSIIVLVHREDEVLLGRNHMFPEGLYSTLAGFVEPGESIEETVIREVKEEVGVNVGNLSYLGSQPWPFPNSLMLGFHAEYESGDIVLQEDEIADAKWFKCDDLPMIPGKFAISRWLIDDYLNQRGIAVEPWEGLKP